MICTVCGRCWPEFGSARCISVLCAGLCGGAGVLATGFPVVFPHFLQRFCRDQGGGCFRREEFMLSYCKRIAMRRCGTIPDFFVWCVGRMRKRNANQRESRSLRSLRESHLRNRRSPSRPSGRVALLIANAPANAGRRLPGVAEEKVRPPYHEKSIEISLLTTGGARKAPSSIFSRVCDNDPRSGEWSTALPCDSNALAGDRRQASGVKKCDSLSERDSRFFIASCPLTAQPTNNFQKNSRKKPTKYFRGITSVLIKNVFFPPILRQAAGRRYSLSDLKPCRRLGQSPGITGGESGRTFRWIRSSAPVQLLTRDLSLTIQVVLVE